jgi:hypothetical protein
MPIRVRTPAGERFYKEPIGTEVYRHSIGQSPSSFIHPDTGHVMGKSEVGDTYEELFRQHGAHLLEDKLHQPYSPVAHTKGEGDKLTSRTTPLDFKLDGKYGGELKTLNAKAKNQKTAIKKEELDRKYRALVPEKLSPALAVQVVDQDSGKVHVYYHHDFASKRVTAMEHLGSYSYTPEDFQRAQEATGHWTKRHARAAMTTSPNQATALSNFATEYLTFISSQRRRSLMNLDQLDPKLRKVYVTRHRRVVRIRGPASNYTCEACEFARAEDWATLHGETGDDPSDYASLCRSCHRMYDTGRKAKEPTSLFFVDEEVLISEKELYRAVYEAFEEYGL